MIDPDVQSACDEFGIKIVPANVVPQIGETRAPHTLALIKVKHGKDHMRFVVGTMAETANNRALLDETMFWSVSDMARAFRKNFPRVMDHDLDAWFSFFDRTPTIRSAEWPYPEQIHQSRAVRGWLRLRSSTERCASASAFEAPVRICSAWRSVSSGAGAGGAGAGEGCGCGC